MERNYIFRAADAVHRGRMIDDPRHSSRGERCGDDRGSGALLPLSLECAAADDYAADFSRDGVVHDVRLVAADEYALLAGLVGFRICLGESEIDDPGDGIDLYGELVDKRALEDAQQVEHGDVLDAVVVDAAHVIQINVAFGKHSVQRAVVVLYGKRVEIVVHHQLPCGIDGDGSAEYRRTVEIEVSYLGAHIPDPHGRLESEAVQKLLGLVVYRADARGDVFGIADRVAQIGIGNGRYDRVGIRISVPCNKYLTHKNSSPYVF